jgi:uncharacterized protein YndB with AHSA1/START domain
MTSNPTPKQAALGTLEQVAGKRVLRFERRLDHPVERVWAALTEPEQLAGWLAAADELELAEGGGWLAEADLGLVAGGRVQLRWLNNDDEGGTAVATGTISALEPPRVLEFDTGRFGTLRWELREDGSGCVLTFTSGLPEEFPEEMAAQTMAGWHSHLDLLADALAGRPVVDWSKQSLSEWAQLRDRYAETLS